MSRSRTARVRAVATIAAVVTATAIAAPAVADDEIPGHRIDRPLNGLVIAGAASTALAVSLIPMRDGGLWNRELFGWADGTVHDNFSRRAAAVSDVLLIASVAAPIGYLMGATTEDADGDRLLLYSETLAVNLALFQAVKHLVQRPRPYLYSRSPEAARYATEAGDDSRMSFYSGHAATTFCAATAGAYLLSASSGSRGARAMAWGGGFAAAATAANLRVRAGKHFYSDIAVGTVVGIAVGYAIPALHADARPYTPSASEIGAAAAGMVGGALLSQLLPLGQSTETAEPGALAALRRAHLQLGPVPVPGGAGLGISGLL